MKRKHLLKSTVIFAVIGAMMTVSSGSIVMADDNTAVSTFADPDTTTSMKIRTWWPSADITDEQIADEVKQIADAGFGGIELIGITEGYDGDAIDAEKYGWSTENWNHAVEVLNQEADKYNLTVDLTIGPRWPAGVPGMDLSSDASSKKAVTSVLHTNIESTEEGSYEIPAAPESETGSTFITLVAARTDGTLVEKTEEEKKAAEEAAAESGPWAQVAADEYGIYSDSLQVIDAEAVDTENGTFKFTPSEAGEWTFFAFYSVATGQTSGDTSPTAYVIDHFSRAGTDAMLNYWEENMLSDAQKTQWQEKGGDLFEDSLELTSCDIPWSVDLESYFKENKGYDIDKYLPLLVSQLTTGDLAEKYNVLDNDTISSEVYNDFFNNLSDMYINNHVKVVEEWCKNLNVKYRAQAQGTSDNGWVDSIEAASYLDVAEGETLGMAKSPDAFRSLAGAANMGGTEKVSVELGAEFSALYQVTWQRLNELVNRSAMAGANQFVLHGFATDSQNTSANAWPGWMPFDEPRFSEAWGQRQPSWDYMSEFTDYVSRLQTALQYGSADVNFAVYRDDLGIRTDEGYTDGVLYLDEESLPGENAAVENGYTYNYISPGNFDLETATVEDGVLNKEYAGYKALVINNEKTMELSDAQKILEYAKDGLKIVLVGETPSTDGTYSAEDDQAVQDVFTELKGMDNVITVETEDKLPEALKEAGIQPSAQYDEKAMLAVQHRHSDDADLYYFYNYTGSYDYGTNDQYYSDDASIVRTVTVEGKGQPYKMNPWTGEITLISDYTDNGDGTLSMQLEVADGEAVVIGISEDTSLFGEAKAEKKTTDGESVSLDDQEWTLTVTSYEPGENAQDKDAEGYDAADTAKKDLDSITLDGLKSWKEIDGLSDISGQGFYTTTFTLEEGVNGAVLDLGDCYDNILEVTVNGEVISGIDQITHKVDLGSAAVAGENTLTIRTGTTLAAAVRKAGGNCSEEDSYSAYPTEYGLLGGVTVTGYTVEE